MKIFSVIIMAALLTSCAPALVDDASTPGSELGFSLDIFKAVLAESKPDSNVTVSPFSAGVALSMLAEGSEGETGVELDKALNGCLFKDIDLGNNDSVTVLSANSVWLDDDFAVRNRYVDLLQKDYDALATTLNFADPATVHAINNWCSEHTEGMIDEILPELPSDLKMILANALYFNASWLEPFDENQTRDDVFHGSCGDSQQPFMRRKDYYDYAEYEGNQLIRIPYKSERYSMYVLLPSEPLGTDGALKYISQKGVKEALGMLKRTEVNLRLPKFRTESDMSLVKPLEAMGLRTVFTSAADLSGIARGPLAVSDVLQKTVVELDEKGTEAAAVTAILVKMTSVRPDSRQMNVNRPFYYMIADMDSERILFVGRIMNL